MLITKRVILTKIKGYFFVIFAVADLELSNVHVGEQHRDTDRSCAEGPFYD